MQSMPSLNHRARWRASPELWGTSSESASAGLVAGDGCRPNRIGGPAVVGGGRDHEVGPVEIPRVRAGEAGRPRPSLCRHRGHGSSILCAGLGIKAPSRSSTPRRGRLASPTVVGGLRPVADRGPAGALAAVVVAPVLTNGAVPTQGTGRTADRAGAAGSSLRWHVHGTGRRKLAGNDGRRRKMFPVVSALIGASPLVRRPPVFVPLQRVTSGGAAVLSWGLHRPWRRVIRPARARRGAGDLRRR